MGVCLLLELQDILTDSIDGMQATKERLGNPDNFGVNIETRNSWPGGTDQVAMAKSFTEIVWHVHWKDLPADWEAKRGTMYGCGFEPIALGDGVIDVAGVFDVMQDSATEYSTLEVGGDDNLLKSDEYLKSIDAE